MVAAIAKELVLRKNYLPKDSVIETIYFGGGTPSLLNNSELESLLNTIFHNYTIQGNAEITLEANPDDLNLEKLRELKNTPVNRLSIGIQSFYEEDLRWMNRAHSAKESETVLENAFKTGFQNLTADLIFGYPLLSDKKWESNINRMLQSGVQHLSAYCMTVEKGTPMARFVQKKQQLPMDEEQAGRQFLFLMNKMKVAKWEQYEISNYAQNGCLSRHNTNYWMGIPYLGVGPSAHSFDGESRQWNTKVNSRYIQKLNSGALEFEREILTFENKFNEYVMTALRTRWGIGLDIIKKKFGKETLEALLQKSRKFEKAGQVVVSDKEIQLTTNGKLFADKIAMELFEE